MATTRRGGRVVECTGLENRSPCKRTAGSNPAPSAGCGAESGLFAGNVIPPSGASSLAGRLWQLSGGSTLRPMPTLAEISKTWSRTVPVTTSWADLVYMVGLIAGIYAVLQLYSPGLGGVLTF